MTEEKQVWWIHRDDQIVTLGPQKAALAKWGQLRFLDLPLLGTHVIIGDRFITVEAENSLTYASSPVAGTIIAINSALNGWVDPASDDCQWLVRIRRDTQDKK